MRDMTTGVPIRQIAAFFFPLLAGTLFQQFYSIADSVLVGQLLGVNAFAAVGSTGSLIGLILCFAISGCTGFAVPITQSFGAGDMEKVRVRIAQSIWLSALITVFITVFTFFIAEDLLRLINTPADIFDDAYTYLFINFMGTGGIVLYNMVSAILRALGDSRTPLYCLIIAVVLNVALDYVFMAPMQMGVAGAALATVLSQLLSGVACLVYIYYRVPELHLGRDHLRFNRKEMACLAAVGLPLGLQDSIISVGTLTLQSVTNALGTEAVAAFSVGNRLFGFVTAPDPAIGATVTTYVGQNIGAGKPERIRRGLWQVTVCAIIYWLATLLFSFFLGKPVAQIFVEASEVAVIHDAWVFNMINTAIFPFLLFLYIYRSAIQGMGFSGPVLLGATAELITRVVASYMLVSRLGFVGVSLTGPLAWIAADIAILPLYFIKMRQVERQLRFLDHHN